MTSGRIIRLRPFRSQDEGTDAVTKKRHLLGPTRWHYFREGIWGMLKLLVYLAGYSKK